MAVLHQAELRPTKLELLTSWLPTLPWSGLAGGEALRVVATFRFDDPAGEVGVETFLVRAGDGPLLNVPLTYRAAPLEGAEDFLVTTLEHSVLGRRWVHDAAGDPVWADAAHRAAVTGGREADLQRAVDGRLEPAPKNGWASGDGDAAEAGAITAVEGVSTEGAVTTVRTPLATIVLPRVLTGPAAPALPAGARLTASWGEDEAAAVAVVLP
ncbi:CG0192-related protein [Kineococcus sp. SYSU DK006]|uniref:CG0192-related protein n=1 Tax=Kineococcus sp. SYSU DK006 TaxID=3383127 RepID=UPI003D7C55D1